MATVHFTANMRRHVDCPALEVDGATVGAVLDAYFAIHPAVRSYVLDEQGAVRRHVAIFNDGSQISDPRTLSDPVPSGSEIYVMQALSGGM
jgi:molybdopterin converting factor small subunit